MGERMSCDVGGKLEKNHGYQNFFKTKLLHLLCTSCVSKKDAKVPKYSNAVLRQTNKFKFPTYLLIHL